VSVEEREEVFVGTIPPPPAGVARSARPALSLSLTLPISTLTHSFEPRHNSATPAEIDAMVAITGFPSLEALVDATVPASIRRRDGMDIGAFTPGMTEAAFLEKFK